MLLTVTLKGLCLSLFVETFQYIVPMRRSADVDDLILNTIGAFVGYMIWKMCYKLAPNTFRLSTSLEKEKRNISSLDR
ncbi:VanZ family protein [Microbacteriaceae bacterium 4G12]